MKRCLELAKLGRGYVSPNPLVGSVIVYQNEIIGEGFHQKFGEAHAEVNAIASVKNPDLLCESTLYVNLEPCSHVGKTPACSNLIKAHSIPRVVMAMGDPFPQVQGRGKAMLEAAGIEVLVGVMEKEARELNRFYLSYIEKKSPFITLKWASSRDGFIDAFENKPRALSSPQTNVFMHEIRSHYDAILVGFRTALKDNPSLRVRHVSKPSPKRFVFDAELQLPDDLQLFTDEFPIYILNYHKEALEGKKHFIRLQDRNQPALEIKKALYAMGITSLLVEGGSKTHRLFLESGNWDEIIEIQTPLILEKGIAKAAEMPAFPKPVCMYENEWDKVFSYRKESTSF